MRRRQITDEFFRTDPVPSLIRPDDGLGEFKEFDLLYHGNM